MIASMVAMDIIRKCGISLCLLLLAYNSRQCSSFRIPLKCHVRPCTSRASLSDEPALVPNRSAGGLRGLPSRIYGRETKVGGFLRDPVLVGVRTSDGRNCGPTLGYSAERWPASRLKAQAADDEDDDEPFDSDAEEEEEEDFRGDGPPGSSTPQKRDSSNDGGMLDEQMRKLLSGDMNETPNLDMNKISRNLNGDIEGSSLTPPPDLPSMLLHNRIIYIGLPLSSSVTQLTVSQLLYLSYESIERPIYIYINSSGSELVDRTYASLSENEALAIIDVMKFVKAPIYTIAIGRAHGSAALLLSCGQKGHRYALPNTSLVLRQPISSASGFVSDISIRAKQSLIDRDTVINLFAQHTNQTVGQIKQAYEAGKYFSPSEAQDIGIIDQVVEGPPVVKAGKEEKLPNVFNT